MLALPSGATFANFALSADGTAMAANLGGTIYRWTAGTGFVSLGAGDPFSASIGISAGGDYIAATRQNADGNMGPQRWDKLNGWIELGHPSNGCALNEGSTASWGSAYGVSGNGGVVVGLAWTCDSRAEGFAWTPNRGMVSLGHPPKHSSRASAVSADGSTIVGFSEDPQGGFRRAMRWRNGGATLIAGTHTPGEASAVSSDGSQIVGQSDAGTWAFGSAFYFTQTGGLVVLGTLSGRHSDSSYANGTSDDGTIVGWSGASFSGVQRAFIRNKNWADPRMRSLRHVLAAHGAKIPANIVLGNVLAISADGSTVAGTWVDASFHQGSFLAHLP
jgi:probable HAF family extracellular repeat protein